MKKQSLNQRAAVIRRQLKKQGITTLKDGAGLDVPVDYIPAGDILKHGRAIALTERARELHQLLADFRAECQQTGDELYELMMQEEDIKSHSKGGFVLTDFQKEVKIKFRMDTRTSINETELQKARHFKDEYLKEYEGQIPTEVIHLVNMVFERDDQKIDVNRIRPLNRMRNQIKSKNFQKFLDHYNMAIETEHTKRFETFHEKNDQGEWDSIILSYTRIKPEGEDQAEGEEAAA